MFFLNIRRIWSALCITYFKIVTANTVALFIYLFIYYATEAAHITLQTYKIKHKVKTQSIKNSKNTTQQRNHKFTVWNVLLLIDNYACVKGTFI